MYRPKKLTHTGGIDVMTLVDRPLLSRFLNAMNLYLDERIKICLIGGSALTILGMRENGSEDIDILLLDKPSVVEHAINEVVKNWRHLTIQVQHLGTLYTYYFNPHTQIQTFTHGRLSMRSMGYLQLPDDYEKYMKHVHVVQWVVPSGGQLRNIPTKRIFPKIEVYTLGMLDLICTKLFNPRFKDKNDLMRLLHHLPTSMRFFKWKRDELTKRFMDFVRANKHNKALIRTGVNEYNYFRKEFAHYLSPLPAEVEDFI